MESNNLFTLAKYAINESDAACKCTAVSELLQAWEDRLLCRDPIEPGVIEVPGLPRQVELVAIQQLSRRGLGSNKGRAAFIHSLVHIEFMAINLALDAVYRFQDLPDEYYADWLRIASEEACHFQLLQNRLSELGYAYGEFKAHAGLWQAALDSRQDVLARMALVPRVMEARGLDVTPGMIVRLRQVGDVATAQILERILRDEITHVACGTHWFRFVCDQRALNPDHAFGQIIMEYMDNKPRGPYAEQLRRQAGFSDQELTFLQTLR